MKVLKFGGTSVGSSENISKVTKIVINESEKSSIVIVVSAVGGITNKLISASSKAVAKNLDYKNDIKKIKIQHEKIINNLLNGNSLLETKEIVSVKLSELENLLDGIYLINEISPKTTDKLLSYGELISSLIIFEYLRIGNFVTSTSEKKVDNRHSGRRTPNCRGSQPYGPIPVNKTTHQTHTRYCTY